MHVHALIDQVMEVNDALGLTLCVKSRLITASNKDRLGNLWVDVISRAEFYMIKMPCYQSSLAQTLTLQSTTEPITAVPTSETILRSDTCNFPT